MRAAKRLVQPLARQQEEVPERHPVVGLLPPQVRREDHERQQGQPRLGAARRGR